MRRIGVIVVGGSALLLVGASIARADLACRQTAKENYLACKSQCKSDFLDARFTCGNVQPACGEACLAGRQQCFDNVDLVLETGVVSGHCSMTSGDQCHLDGDCPTGETCVADSTLANCPGGTDACQAAFLATATNTCGATCSQDAHPACVCNGNQTCSDCIDQAQVTRFLCRDACGDSFRTNSTVLTLKASCRSTFKACVQACPPAN